jgi:phosphate butyryltransferase
MIRTFDNLLARTRETVAAKRLVKAAMVGNPGSAMLQALLRASEEKILNPLVLGDKDRLQSTAEETGCDIASLAAIQSDSFDSTAALAAKMIGEKQVDMLIVEENNARALLHTLFTDATGFASRKKRVSHVAMFEHEKYPKLLLMTDGAVNVAPDINHKLAIIQNAVGLAQAFGIETPKVAVLAAVEVVYPAMPVTTDGAILAKMSDRRQVKGCIIDGPLSMDVATVPEVAHDKGVESAVAGDADILLAPNIETGNGIYKAMSLVVGAAAAGVVLGGSVPVALPARCDGPDNIFNSLAVSALMAAMSMR